jgi:hypothetical protein
MYNTANQHNWLWNGCVSEHVTVHSRNRIRTFPSLLTNIGHCPTWLHEGNTQGSPPATHILKSLTCGKDFEGASIHVCRVTVTAGNSPSSTGPHISSGAAACTQEGAHCFQWLPAYQSARKCSVEGIALKQKNPLCYQHEVSGCFSGKQEHIVSKKNRQCQNSRVPGRNVQNVQWVESQKCHINQAIKHISTTWTICTQIKEENLGWHSPQQKMHTFGGPQSAHTHFPLWQLANPAPEAYPFLLCSTTSQNSPLHSAPQLKAIHILHCGTQMFKTIWDCAHLNTTRYTKGIGQVSTLRCPWWLDFV